MPSHFVSRNAAHVRRLRWGLEVRAWCCWTAGCVRSGDLKVLPIQSSELFAVQGRFTANSYSFGSIEPDRQDQHHQKSGLSLPNSLQMEQGTSLRPAGNSARVSACVKETERIGSISGAKAAWFCNAFQLGTCCPDPRAIRTVSRGVAVAA